MGGMRGEMRSCRGNGRARVLCATCARPVRPRRAGRASGRGSCPRTATCRSWTRSSRSPSLPPSLSHSLPLCLHQGSVASPAPVRAGTVALRARMRVRSRAMMMMTRRLTPCAWCPRNRPVGIFFFEPWMRRRGRGAGALVGRHRHGAPPRPGGAGTGPPPPPPFLPRPAPEPSSASSRRVSFDHDSLSAPPLADARPALASACVDGREGHSLEGGGFPSRRSLYISPSILYIYMYICIYIE